MNETTVLVAILGAAVAAVSNLGSAVIGYLGKRRETTVQQTISDRDWIKKLTDRVDALEIEIAALHQENAELRELLVLHKITPPRPRLRSLTPEPA